MTMNTASYRRLCALHDRHGPREFGKICQKLLALAFRAGGCPHVVERGVQGVDIDAAWEGEKYTAEIKTTRSSTVYIAPKDVTGLESRSRDGYRPMLGVLRLSPLSDWLLVDAIHLKAGGVSIDLLRPYRHPSLEPRLRVLFDGVLETHFEPTHIESQTYLDRILREWGVQVLPCE
jgi:Holliday junction resolvase